MMRICISTLIVFLLASSLAVAEPMVGAERSGRLPDGKAYRTDEKGNQIVDYIAELEVTNEALERRIRGLLNEIEDLRAGSQRSAASFANRASIGGGLKERELVSGEPLSNTLSVERRDSLKVTPKVPSPSTPVAASAAGTCGERECDIFISEVRARGERVVAQQKQVISKLTEEKKSCDQQFEAFRTALDAHEKEEADLTQDFQKAKLRISSLEDLLGQREQELKAAEKKLSSLGVQLASTRSNNETLQRQLTAKSAERNVEPNVKQVRAVGEEPRASIAQKSISNMQRDVAPPSAEPAILDDNRDKVENIYKSVIALRNKRDRLFKAYNSSTLTIQKRAIRSRSGKLPEQLLGLVKSTNSPSQLVALAKEGKRMEKLALQDISLMKRLADR